jgi:hypothetical protein
VPESIGLIVSSRLATFTELDTVLGLEDLYDLMEILTVDAYNSKADV